MKKKDKTLSVRFGEVHIGRMLYDNLKGHGPWQAMGGPDVLGGALDCNFYWLCIEKRQVCIKE